MGNSISNSQSRHSTESGNEIQNAGPLENGNLGNLNVDYIQASTKELGRYFMVLRLSLAKATASSARWEQYTIPAKIVVFLNSWACGRDSEELEKAWDFRPEWWLGNSDKRTHQFAFGFGGRMCVATYISHNVLYTVYLHLLAHFEIRPVDGETSESAIDPLESLKGVEGTAATPRKFKARFTPRNKTLLQDYIVDGAVIQCLNMQIEVHSVVHHL
jgi:3-hydroxyphenylacetate 6-hydroxylase